MNKNILVLGANGLVGHQVFNYLSSFYPNHVWGTSRTGKNSKQFILRAEAFSEHSKRIAQQVGKIDYLINCIAVLDEKKSKKEIGFVNGVFPHILEEYAQEHNAHIIHISTDAVFSPSSQNIDEGTQPYPITLYGKTKLQGETNSKNALTIRSSFIGFDPINHRGIMEKIQNATGVFQVSDNQLWSGCTTLQFAKFCQQLIESDSFETLRSFSNIFHFAPIGPITKYQLALAIAKKIGLNSIKIKKENTREMKRYLETKYFDILELKCYTCDIEKALSELILYND